MKFFTKPNNLSALLIVAIIDAALLFFGLQILFTPKIYLVARSDNPFLYYEGHILIFLSVAIAWFRDWTAKMLLLIIQKIYLLLSALLLVFFLSIDAIMHFLSIPHIEGWWLPLVGGSASAIIAFLPKWLNKAKKCGKNCEEHHG